MQAITLPLKPEEDIVTTIHQDILALIPRLCLLSAWFVVPFFFFFALISQGWIGWLVFFALVMPALLLLAKTFYRFTRTTLVVTSQRVISIKQQRWFEREVVSIPFSRIEEIRFLSEGLVGRRLNLGDLLFCVRDRETPVRFTHVRFPERAVRLLSDLKKVYEVHT